MGVGTGAGVGCSGVGVVPPLEPPVDGALPVEPLLEPPVTGEVELPVPAEPEAAVEPPAGAAALLLTLRLYSAVRPL